MKNTINIFILLVLGIGWVGGCGDGESDSPSPQGSEAGAMVFSADEGRRHVEAAWGYSYIPPEGWRMEDLFMQGFQTAIGEPFDGFSPNIIVSVETLSGTLDEYHKHHIQDWERTLPGYKLLKTETLTTEMGLDVMKMVCDTGQMGNRMRQFLYYIEADNDKKYVITCSFLKEDTREDYNQLFDGVTKTFQESEREVNVFTADEGRRHVEAAGGYSFIPPEGWKMSKEAAKLMGLEYQVALGKPVAGYGPNINVDVETFIGTLEEYLTYNIQEITKTVPSFKVLKTEALTTEMGQEVIKMVCESDQLIYQLRHIIYLLADNDRKYAMTCSYSKKDTSKDYGQLFDAVAKTFRVEQRDER